MGIGYESFDPGSSVEAFRGMHQGEPMIVCGCGNSLSELPENLPVKTIGVNDCWERFMVRSILFIMAKSNSHWRSPVSKES